MDYLLEQTKQKYFSKIHLELKKFQESKLGYEGLIFALDCDYNSDEKSAGI